MYLLSAKIVILSPVKFGTLQNRSFRSTYSGIIPVLFNLEHGALPFSRERRRPAPTDKEWYPDVVACSTVRING
jgi:hypothetical protein